MDKDDTEQTTLDGNQAEILTLPRAGVQTTKRELEQLYLEEKYSIGDVADEFGVSNTSVHRLLDEAGIDRRTSEEQHRLWSEEVRSRPYAQEENLRELHQDDGLSFTEIAEKYDMTSTGIARWFRIHDIETDHQPKYPIPEFRLCYDHQSGYGGYPVWVGCDGQTVAVHHLVVIAEGADPHKVFGDPKYNVHHRNSFKCDNRPSNLDLVDRNEHGRYHGNYSKKWTDDDLEYAVRAVLNPQEWLND